MSKTGILIAMAAECRSLTDKRIPAGGCLELDEGLVIGFSGAGPDAARRNAELLARQGIQSLVSWGCAAALADGMEPGDLVLPDSIIGSEGDSIPTDAAWGQRLTDTLGQRIKVLRGSLAESSRIVGKEADKRAIHSATGAIALDMESAAAARASRDLGFPFLAVRSIVDGVAVNLPDSIEAAFDDKGMLNVPRMLGRVLLNPSDFGHIFRLGRHFNAAMETLKTVAALARQTRFDAP